MPNPCPVPWQICVEDYTRAGGFICKGKYVIQSPVTSSVTLLGDLGSRQGCGLTGFKRVAGLLGLLFTPL